MINRDQIQAQIDTILKNNPNAKLDVIKSGLSTWLDTFQLETGALTHEFMRDHILEDINSYNGMENK